MFVNLSWIMFLLVIYVVDQRFLDIDHIVCCNHCSFHLWKSIYVNFITNLPSSKGYDVCYSATGEHLRLLLLGNRVKELWCVGSTGPSRIRFVTTNLD